eukprot:1104467-Pelagomonas_calceolata.AAC.1
MMPKGCTCIQKQESKNQLKTSRQHYHDLCRHLSRASAQVTLHIIRLGVGGVIYTPHTLEPLKEL